MRFKFACLAASTTVSLLFATASRAATYTESGDAGDLPATAQVVSGAAGTMLSSISGALTLANGVSDSDMYQIYVSSPTTFSAATTSFVPGANNFDTQIALFNASGVGVVANDDAAGGGSQSAIPAGSLTLSVGNYYLLISGSGRYALTSTGALIFPNFNDGATDPTATVAATSASPITGYTGSSSDSGNYVVTLAGAQFVSAVPAPEPGPFAAVLAGAAGMVLLLRARRRAAR